MTGHGLRRGLRSLRAPPEEPGSPVAARAKALGLLSRRDYARAALKSRLTGAGFAAEASEAALATLERERLLNDARYAEAAVAARIARGQGPLRIALELRRAGLAAGLVRETIEAHAAEWEALATALARRRFGATAARSGAERTRQARFLLGRGFTGRQVSAALGAAGRDEFEELELDAQGEVTGTPEGDPG